MENPQSQPPNDRAHDVSFDPPDDQTGSSGGKTPLTAPAREIPFDPPDDEVGSSGGKTPLTAPARER